MKISCSKTELINSLQFISKAVANKPQTPILAGIYLRAENGILELQATDYEISLVCKIPADIIEAGQITIAGRYFQEVIRKLPGDNVKIEFNNSENIVHIQSNLANFTLLSMNAADYPTITPIDGDIKFTIKDNVLRSLIKKTVFACATDESRPVFTGCYLEIAGTKVTMAATNTHRLAVKYETFDERIGNIKIIIPAKILQELLHNMTSEIPTDVTVTCNYSQISFAFENLYMSSRLIEGAFPDYNRVIPPDFTTTILVNTADFSAAVDRISLISRSGEYNIIKLDFSNSNVKISSNNPAIGNAEEYLPATIEGPDITIAFNAQYISDVLKNIDSPNCRIKLNSALSPAAIREESDTDFIYVVTPVRTNH